MNVKNPLKAVFYASAALSVTGAAAHVAYVASVNPDPEYFKASVAGAMPGVALLGIWAQMRLSQAWAQRTPVWLQKLGF